MYDMYTTRRLIQAVEGINPADSFLRDRYFPSNGTKVDPKADSSEGTS